MKSGVLWRTAGCNLESRRRWMEIGMMLKRIISGSIVTLLLSVSSLAAACDLSCAFASADSDCHSQELPSHDAANAGMKMDGTDMAGMKMPEAAKGEDRQSDSAISRLKDSHPSISEMEPCEKQACYDAFAVSAKTARFVDSQIHSLVGIVEAPGAEIAPLFFYDARDDGAPYHPLDASPLHLSLRI